MLRLFLAAWFALALSLPLRADVEIIEVTSPGGLTAWLVQAPSIPFTALEIRFRCGTALDEAGREGAVNLMTSLLDEGAGDMDARSFAAAREALAARFSFSAGRDSVTVSARFLSENRQEAVELLRLALVAPRFDEDALERVREQVLSAIRSSARNPSALATQSFNRLAFGTHPFARPGEGTAESVAALDVAALRAAHAAALAQDRMVIGAAGDISPEDLGLLLDRLLGGLPAHGAPLPGPTTFQAPGGVSVVPFDGPQAVIAFGHAGISRDDPDFFAAFVLNEILGGGRFGTRLMRELRESRGLTYGVGTWLGLWDDVQTLQGSMSTDNAKAAAAVDVLRAEWARMAGQGVTAEEREHAITYLTGAYPLRFDGNASIASILASMQFQGYPIDYVQTRNARVEAVSLEDLNTMAARLLDADALHFVVVGQPEGLSDLP